MCSCDVTNYLGTRKRRYRWIFALWNKTKTAQPLKRHDSKNLSIFLFLFGRLRNSIGLIGIALTAETAGSGSLARTHSPGRLRGYEASPIKIKFCIFLFEEKRRCLDKTQSPIILKPIPGPCRIRNIFFFINFEETKLAIVNLNLQRSRYEKSHTFFSGVIFMSTIKNSEEPSMRSNKMDEIFHQYGQHGQTDLVLKIPR